MTPVKKEKITEKEKSKSRSIKVPGAVDQTAEDQQWLKAASAVWADEIEKFRGARFDSFEEALHSLVQRVTERLPNSNEGLTEFLLNFLETDPEIQRILARYVRTSD